MSGSGTQVLVTGGCGFIGQHLVDALISRSYRVRILDLRPPRTPRLDIQYIAGSANDPAVTELALNGMEQVYHLAAIPGMWRSDKEAFIAANIKCTAVMLTAARRRGIARFLHCSTESVLFDMDTSGGTITEDIKSRLEDMPGAYTRSKKTAEEIALAAAAEGLDVVVASPTMPIGSHPYELTPPTAMIAHFLARRVQFYIDGIFNLVDARDVATGLILAMERGRAGERYILGGENTSLRKLLGLIAVLAGARSVPVRIPATAALAIAGIMELLADRVSRRAPAATCEGVKIAMRARPLSSEKARRELGYAWRPLDVALQETIRWLRERGQAER